MPFANLVVKIAGDITSLDASTKKAVERVKALGANLQSVGSSLALGISAPLAGIAGVALKSAGDLEALKLGLVSVAGGAKQAEAQFKQLREVAKLPGLGLQEAVQGSINLQALGFSAEKSRNLLLQFGNALATVGRGREDLNEVIRQLGQLGARGVVTADNLRPIIERVPQVASIIKEKFGGDALGNPAETFKKLGISSQEFIAILEEELGKLPRVTGGLKNDFENLRDSVTIAFAQAGEALAPFAKAFIDQFAVPATERLAALAESFKSLSSPIQSAAVGLGALVTVAPLIVAGAGSMIANFALITEALGKVGGAAAAASLALKGFILVAGAVSAVSLYEYYKSTAQAAEDFNKSQKDLERSLSATVLKLREQGAVVGQSLVDDWNRGRISSAEFAKELRKIALEIGKNKAVVDPAAQSQQALTKEMLKAQQAADAMSASLERNSRRLSADTVESRVLAEELRILEARHQDVIRTAAEFRLGLRKQSDLFSELPPKIDETGEKLRDLGRSFSIVQEAIRNSNSALAGALPPAGISREGMKRAEEVSREGQRRLEEDLKTGAKQTRQFERQVSLIANDLARNITDLITKGGKLKDVMSSAFAEMGKALLRSAIETQLKRIVGLVLNLATSLPGVGKAIGAIFGAGGSAAGGVARAAGSVAGAAGSAAGGSGGAVSGAVGAAGSGATAIVGAVAGVASAVSSIIGNFQMAGMNKSLDLIVKHTLQTANQLIEGIQPQINTYLPYLRLVHDRLATITTQGIGVYNAPSDAGLRLQGGGAGVTININNPTFGPGTNQASITAMMQEAARQAALAGAA